MPNARSIYNKKFLSLIGSITVYGLVCLSFVTWMMRKTKFYQSPYELSKNKNLDSNMNFFYDPFVVFLTLVFLNLIISILGNAKYLFQKSFFGNFKYFFYFSFLLIGTLNLLFVYQLYRG